MKTFAIIFTDITKDSSCAWHLIRYRGSCKTYIFRYKSLAVREPRTFFLGRNCLERLQFGRIYNFTYKTIKGEFLWQLHAIKRTLWLQN